MSDRRRALLDLASLLGLSAAGSEQLELAFDRPEELLGRFAQAFSERGIDAPIPGLPWIRLVDALCDERRCAEVDWKEDGEAVVLALARLGVGDAKLRRAQARAEAASTEDLLGLLGEKIEPSDLALCSIDYGSDSYALVVLAAGSVARAQELATAAGFGRLVRWSAVRSPKKRVPKGSRAPPLRDLAEWTGRASKLLALPSGRAIALTGARLRLLVPGETAERLEAVDDLVPVPKRGPFGQLALFRSAAGFGVLSNRRVRLWPSGELGEGVTLEIDGELPANSFGHRPAPERGGTSDRPDQAIVIFHSAGSNPFYLARLQLDVASGRASWVARQDDGHLPVLRSSDFPVSELARLQPSLFPLPLLQHASLSGGEQLVCATAPGEKELVHLVRVGPDGSAERLLSLDERGSAELTSCGQYLLATFFAPRRAPRQALWSLREHTWVVPFNLVAASKSRQILDHDGGVWWLGTVNGVIACAPP